uniref:Cadherin domain-containing protein n=1 Tax=Lates calcarifer TaxID=8187 RepID=A0A4W6DSJ8_LATCA
RQPHWFLQSHYQLEVGENNQPGIPLLQVSASDADSGHNGRVTYSLDKHTSTIFNIDSVTGQLSVSASLDREQQGIYNLTVFAQDSGSPPLESVTTVLVVLMTDVWSVVIPRSKEFFTKGSCSHVLLIHLYAGEQLRYQTRLSDALSMNEYG